MPEQSPWDSIAVPSTGFNVLQVSSRTAVPCFWGRDSEGSCLFIIELKGDLRVQFRRDFVAVQGVKTDLRESGAGQQLLVLTLEMQVDRDLFAGLCRTLASALQNAPDDAGALAVAFRHIRRWKAFLAGRGGPRLTPEKVLGLFAEVKFLDELLSAGFPARESVEAWLGPERSHQDFIFGNTAVEIKALSGTERSKTRISSEDQLESLNDSLFLRIYRLSSLPDAAGSLSLNELVTSVESKLDDAEAGTEFDKKLTDYGYAPLTEYDSPTFLVTGIHTYEVLDGFPKLIRSEISAGIVDLSYSIELEVIAPYRCDNAKVFEGI